MKQLGLFLSMLFISMAGFSQNVILEGYVFEEGNRGYLNTARVVVEDQSSGKILGETFTNVDGFFTMEVSPNKKYELHISKDFFQDTDQVIDSGSEAKVFASVPMKRSPGYMFEITLADEKVEDGEPTDGVRGALIEVYNNTTQEPELELLSHPDPEFRVHLKEGNHYTILMRKDGYLAKKVEAFVNVNGCILCMEGLGRFGPGVSDNLTEGNEFGVLLANVEMEKVFEGKTMEIENLYYDLDKAFIRPDAAIELDKVVALMNYNRRLTVELGSHTDSRGTDEYNRELSDRRAKSAVEYIVDNDIMRDRITARGYGESILTNECGNGVDCSEEKHQENRRTEIKVVGIDEGMEFIPLKRMKKIEELERKAINGQLSEQVSGEELSKILSAEDIENTPSQDVNQEKIDKENAKEIVEHKRIVGDNNAIQDVTKSVVSVRPPVILDGAKVVVLSVAERLGDNHQVYKDFPNLILFERPDDQGVYYFVPGYSSREHAQQEIDQGLYSAYPDAFIIEFKEGRIIGQ